ncbi:MAG: hypothetical protein CMJ76_01200 [Planctomycetaceae bacterium]|nr:hypothetical protein [Planctomycetaceae bacterium]|tara:strand:+ start:2448 stop:2936 length:489 start_codon:yes stop_codon:yes gene_type:complete
MLEFHIKKATRLCHKTGEKLQPGESFYSVLVVEENEVVRHDYSEAAWEGVPDDVLAWWKADVPQEDEAKVTLAPDEVVLQYFQTLSEANEHPDMAFILALLMIRKRIMRLDGKEQDEQGNELLVVSCSKSEREYKVPVTSPDASQVEEIQNQLVSMLYKDAA